MKRKLQSGLLKSAPLILLLGGIFMVAGVASAQSKILSRSSSTQYNSSQYSSRNSSRGNALSSTGKENECEVNTHKIRLALLEQQYRVTKFYLERGLDPNVTDEYGMSLTMLSVISNNAELLKLYLDFGADVDKVDSGGRTALFWAVLSGNVEAVEILLTYGANVHTRDNRGKTIDQWLVMMNDVDLVVNTYLKSGILITKNDYMKILWFLYKSRPKNDSSGYILGQSTETIENGQLYTKIYFISSNLGDVREEEFLRIASEGFNRIPRIGENSNYDRMVKLLYTTSR